MSPEAAEAVVLDHLWTALPSLTDTELAEVAAEHAVETGRYATAARAMIAAEFDRRHPMTQPTPAEPFPQPPQLPGGPCVDDPTGLRYDRGDDDGDTPEALRAAEGWPVTGRGPNAAQIKTCGHLDGDVCDCACQDTRDRIELAYAPVIVLPPIRPRDLHPLTVAEVERIKRGAA